jgi:outer membrane protein assembly factor BamB
MWFYFGSGDGKIYALGSSNGDKKWSYKADSSMVANYFGGDAPEKPPVLAKGYLYANSANSVYCLDSVTCKKIWSYKTDRPLISSPTVYNNRVYVGSADPGWFVGPYVDHNLYAFDALTGVKIWNYTFAGSIEAPPVVVGDIVYTGVSYVITESPDFQGNATVYALKQTVTENPVPPSSIPPLLILTLIVAVAVVGVVLLVYFKKRKH